MTPQIRVGIVGVHPDAGWAATAHIPALKQLPEYRITTLSHHDADIARQASQAFGIPTHVTSTELLVSNPEVDLVVVAVKVTRHREIIAAAARAGKAVLSEWPLGIDLAQARELRDIAAAAGIRSAIGLQSRATPAFRLVRDLIAAGQIGRVVSSSLIASGIVWGEVHPEGFRYTLDPATGANMVTVPFAHTIDGVLSALGGKVARVTARTAITRPTIKIAETGEVVPRGTPDQIAVTLELDSGLFLNAHFRGGQSQATNFHWEINGSDGDILVTSPVGYIGAGGFRVQMARAGGALSDVAIPAGLTEGLPDGLTQGVALNYRQLARDIASGGTSTPDFAAAVKLHELIARIEGKDL